MFWTLVQTKTTYIGFMIIKPNRITFKAKVSFLWNMHILFVTEFTSNTNAVTKRNGKCQNVLFSWGLFYASRADPTIRMAWVAYIPHQPPVSKDNKVFCIKESRIISKRWKYELLLRKRVIVFHGQIDNTKLKRDSSSFAKSHCLFMPWYDFYSMSI